MSLLDEVLQLGRCSIELPAGTGKTETIGLLAAESAARGGRVLVLTHTHAGVDALRRRMRKLQVPRDNFTIRTLDAWCFDLIGSFPLLSDIEVEDEPDWTLSGDYHAAARRAVISEAVTRMLTVSYDLVIVDEYQDCGLSQHEVVCEISTHVPTVVLGDRMQGLFFFGGNSPVVWERDVIPVFPNLPQDTVAWRWKGKNETLGEWLLFARGELLSGRPLDLSAAPLYLVDPSDLIATARNAPRHPERSVVMHRWPKDCALLSARLGAGFSMIEELEGRHMLAMADVVDAGASNLADALLDFAVSCAFGVAGEFGAAKRRPLQRPVPKELSRANFPGHEHQVDAINAVLEYPDRHRALAALSAVAKMDGFRPHRREAWFGMLDALRIATASDELTVRQCVVATRNQLRVKGRYPESRIIARPLLIKGLEFDHAFLAQAQGLNAHELYVCMTRGSRSLAVVAASSTISAARPTG